MKEKRYQKRIDFDQIISDSISDEEFNVRETPLAESVSRMVLYATLLVGVVFVGRAVFLTEIDGDLYKARANANINQEIPLIAPRGIIFDRDGVSMVENAAIFTVFLQLDEMVRNGEEEIVLKIAEETLGLERGKTEELLKSTNLESVTDVILKRDVTREQVIAIETLNTKSLIVENDFKRHYSDPAYSHVVGYVNLATQDDLRETDELALNDYVGRVGLEAQYDDLLRGENGSVSILRNAKGDLEGIKRSSDPVSGEELHTTIDAEFQKYFYSRMLQGLASLRRTSGAAIAINPENGEVLAIMSFPSFDGNDISSYLDDTNEPLFNRAVSGLYAPGSTIKPIHATIALSEGVISPTDQILSTGFIEIPNPYFPDQPSRFVDWKAHGWVDLRKALAVSSNVYFYVVSGGFENRVGVGIEKIRGYWEKFGLGKPTGIDLPGEAVGFLPSPEEKEERTGQIWRVGDTYNIAIGQGDLKVSLLELLSGISAIAEGKAFRPHVVGRESVEEIVNIEDLSNVLPYVRSGMQDAVDRDYGSSHLISDLPINVAAKTGTPQIAGNTKTNALIVGYAPTDDPKLAILILVEDAVEGSLNVVPIARDVFGWYYENRLKQ